MVASEAKPIVQYLHPEHGKRVVMNEAGGFIEVQGTAEGHAFRREELDQMLDLAREGIEEIQALQRSTIAEALA